MTSMRAQPFGPTPEQQAGRASRRGFRQAMRQKDFGAAVKFAGTGATLPGAGIGSYEERQATDFLDRQAAEDITSEIGGAMGAGGTVLGRLQSRGLEGARGLSQARGVPTAPTGPVPTPTAVQPPPAPGASQIPENPVSGGKTPLTGDVRTRIQSWGQDGMTDPWRQEFLADAETRVSKGAYRKDAVDEINKERIASGKAPFDRRLAIDMLHNRSRNRPATKPGPVVEGPRLPAVDEPYGLAGPVLPTPRPITKEIFNIPHSGGRADVRTRMTSRLQ